MEEQDNILVPKHKKLLGFALWAKLLAWVVFIFYIFRSGITIIQYQVSLLGLEAFLDPLQSVKNLWTALGDQPYYLVNLIIAILNLLLWGIIFYLVLKGISLGLDMIVETDINYRENKSQEGEL